MKEKDLRKALRCDHQESGEWSTFSQSQKSAELKVDIMGSNKMSNANTYVFIKLKSIISRYIIRSGL